MSFGYPNVLPRWLPFVTNRTFEGREFAERRSYECGVLSSVIESTVNKDKIADRKWSRYVLYEVLSKFFCQVLHILLDFMLEQSESTHMHMTEK